LDREQVIARVDDWEQRLKGLVELLRAWCNNLPQDEQPSFLEGSLLQVSEEMLEEYDVPLRMLPHCAILYGRNRVSFVPGPLWILGANGRVNASTNKKQFVLVDTGGKDGARSDWQIVTSRMQATYRPFTENVFRDLVMKQELMAA